MIRHIPILLALAATTVSAGTIEVYDNLLSSFTDYNTLSIAASAMVVANGPGSAEISARQGTVWAKLAPGYHSFSVWGFAAYSWFLSGFKYDVTQVGSQHWYFEGDVPLDPQQIIRIDYGSYGGAAWNPPGSDEYGWSIGGGRMEPHFVGLVPAPEPSTFVMLGAGAVAFFLARRFRLESK